MDACEVAAPDSECEMGRRAARALNPGPEGRRFEPDCKLRRDPQPRRVSLLVARYRTMDITKVLEPSRVALSSTDTVSLCRPVGMSTPVAKTLLWVTVACRSTRRVMSIPSHPYLTRSVVMFTLNPGCARNRISTLTGLRTARETSGLTSSMAGPANTSGRAVSAVRAADRSRASSPGETSDHGVPARLENANIAISAASAPNRAFIVLLAQARPPSCVGTPCQPLARWCGST